MTATPLRPEILQLRDADDLEHTYNSSVTEWLHRVTL
jgi:hypothetical protein